MNPSYEAMKRARREKLASLLSIRREQAVKRLDELHLSGDSHAMLSQIAYAINPYAGAWDAESCDHLRRLLAELIGGVHEAKPATQPVFACGAGGCDCGNESKEVNDGMAGGGRGMCEVHGNSSFDNMVTSHAHKELDFGYYDVLGNERHKAVCELRGISVDKLVENYDYVDIYPEFMWAVGQAIGLRHGAGFEEIIKRLIHLLGGDQSHDTIPMRQESETGIADEPDDDEYYVLDTSKATTIGYEPDGLVVKNGEHEVRITNSDTIIDGISVVGALDEVASGRLPEFAKKYSIDYMQREIERLFDELEARKRRIYRMQDEIMEWRKVCDDVVRDRDAFRKRLDELERFDPDTAIAAFGDDNEELRKLLSRAARLLADAEKDRDENYSNWMDCKQKVLQSNMTIGGLEDECDELQGTIAELNEQLERRKDKCLRYKTHIDQMQGGSKRLRKELRGQEGMYLDLLRDAARDYKALQDKLDLVLDACKGIN